MNLKEKSEKADLKTQHSKSKIMTSNFITSWQIDGETLETVTNFIFLGSETIANGDCSHETKRYLLLGRKFVTNIDRVLKIRYNTLPIKGV